MDNPSSGIKVFYHEVWDFFLWYSSMDHIVISFVAKFVISRKLLGYAFPWSFMSSI